MVQPQVQSQKFYSLFIVFVCENEHSCFFFFPEVFWFPEADQVSHGVERNVMPIIQDKGEMPQGAGGDGFDIAINDLQIGFQTGIVGNYHHGGIRIIEDFERVDIILRLTHIKVVYDYDLVFV